jgi:putative nucleotidyltransferase with HDIG domain
VPSAAFPWRTPLEEAMHRGRVHAQAVARAIERIALEIDHKAADELVAAALLHDVGKLVLARVAGTGTDERAPATETPEDRVQRERRRFGVDHASVGALLLERWGLPPRLVGGVAGHHRSRDASELATVVRLADLVAHQAHGDPVNRRLMLDLAQSCGITVEVLRDVLFGLPRAGGSRRGRAESSPLSPRETQLLQLLAEGKVYKQIAAEKGLSPSTVRTHLHNAYAKLEVGDRAQAVLRATERGWI